MQRYKKTLFVILLKPPFFQYKVWKRENIAIKESFCRFFTTFAEVNKCYQCVISSYSLQQKILKQPKLP